MADFKTNLKAFLDRYWGYIVAVIITICVCAFFASAAKAAFPVDITLSWDDPTTYMDGSALDPDLDLVQYEAFCTKNDVEVFRANWPKEVGTTAKDFSGAFDGAGTYICQMRVQATNDLWSEYSNQATKHVTGNPNAPVIIDFGAARQPQP